MTTKDFADELRNTKPGCRFVGGIPVRIGTVPIICDGPTVPQRVYEVLGRTFYDEAEAAVWATE
jgi:hypothetical protein